MMSLPCAKLCFPTVEVNKNISIEFTRSIPTRRMGRGGEDDHSFHRRGLTEVGVVQHTVVVRDGASKWEGFIEILPLVGAGARVLRRDTKINLDERVGGATRRARAR